MVLTLNRGQSSPDTYSQRFIKEEVLAKLKALDNRARRKGLQSLDPSKNQLIPLGTEINGEGRVTKNSYGVFHLAWRAEESGDWAARVNAELDEIKQAIKEAHGTRLRFLIWAGMGGSAEDKSMYQGAGLLRRGPRVYVLDSTDPAKLSSILEDMKQRSKLSLPEVLKSTLVAGMAMGMTSYEPVVNLEKLYGLYEKHGIDSRANFIYMTLPGSLLDQFASARGYRRVELQLDNGNATAGRHSGPLTRGSLYPLGLAGNDLDGWIEGACLDGETIQTAWELASYLQTQADAGRDKVTLLLPKSWESAGVWTKQDFEESLGKSESSGIKIVIGENVKLSNYRPPRDPKQDRVFLVVQRKGGAGPDPRKVAALKRAGYPVASIQIPKGVPLSGYMQFIHYVVFGLGYLRNMNFVTQPSVELYKAITARIHAEANQAGGIRQCESWKRFQAPGATLRYRAGVTLHFPFLAGATVNTKDAAAAYAGFLKAQTESGAAGTAELTFFGDTRYSPAGAAVRKALDRAAENVFRSRLKIPVDVYEGPAMNHSYHEMVIGHGGCFSTILISDKAASLPAAGYTAGYHMAQFLATQMALAERNRAVVAIVLKDLEDSTVATLGEFFNQVAKHLK
ncbi:MAG: hypothetical protein FJW39_22010 [Acidobacteria bacterium]|nr:hypothetical protein [Acidobacteriota bacterium]